MSDLQARQRRSVAFAAAATIVIFAVLRNPPHIHHAVQEWVARSLSPGSPTTLPDAIELNFADLSEPLELADTPMYWHIPKAAGTFMDAFFHECLGLVVADQLGGVFGHDEEEALRVIREKGQRFVNVDTSQLSGLNRAKNMGLAESGLADVFVSPYVVPAARVFTPMYRGRMFALFRHPVERAISEFYYLQTATWEPTYNSELKDMTINQYVHSRYIESNWVTRMLVNKLEGQIYENDLETAKDIIGRKCLVGLVRDMDESVRRFDLFFGLDDDDSGEKRKCWQDILGNGQASNRHDHPKLSEESSEWDAIRRINYFDMQLYQYVEGVFEEQNTLMQEIDDAT